MGSYAPDHTDITGSLRPPPPAWTWQGGTPIVVRPGETLETISRRYGVPVAAIVQVNRITNRTTLHPGEHLVIPRRRDHAVATSAPPTPIAGSERATPRPARVAPPRRASALRGGEHVVTPGETLHSIARLYGEPVMVIARANHIRPDTMVRIGERLVIPDAREADLRERSRPASAVPRAEAPAVVAAGDPAVADSPHSARLAETAEQADRKNAVKAEGSTAAMPSFGWPVHGRIIAAFGPKPNGLQNDGINLAVPEGTAIRAAEDGVVAYAGNELKGYGNLVLLRHADGFVTAYANASKILVNRGERVKRGQIIARSGETGNVASPQLHFEIRKGTTPLDPMRYLKGA